MFIRGNKVREESKYDKARDNYLKYFKIITTFELPWPEAAKEYEIGALNKGKKMSS